MEAATRPNLTVIEDPLYGWDGSLSPASLDLLVGKVRALDEKVRDLEAKLAEEHELRVERDSTLRTVEGKLRRLKRDRAAERREDPDRALILELIGVWKRATGHPNARDSADRFDVVKARLEEGYSAEQIRLALAGLGAFPYVRNGQRVARGTPAERYDRIGIALDTGSALERFANLGHLAKKAAA